MRGEGKEGRKQEKSTRAQAGKKHIYRINPDPHQPPPQQQPKKKKKKEKRSEKVNHRAVKQQDIKGKSKLLRGNSE